ncbi:MAG TPA: class I SAM-dependent methyltransferase [Pyrinomonadaceae bacterium]
MTTDLFCRRVEVVGVNRIVAVAYVFCTSTTAMNVTDWNAIADAYSEINAPQGRAVLGFIREKLTKLQPRRLFDYGGGDGKFALFCAESLSQTEIVTYDPSPKMTSLARSLCADFKQIRVIEAIKEVQSGIFDVVTFNGVWMCLATRETCLDALSATARLLRPNGSLIASVTHPCFRTCKFPNYSTDFSDRDYFNDGTLFNVTICEDTRELHIVDTHWSLTAMISQLNESGFAIKNLYELPQSTSGSSQRDASLWLVIVARKL